MLVSTLKITTYIEDLLVRKVVTQSVFEDKHRLLKQRLRIQDDYRWYYCCGASGCVGKFCRWIQAQLFPFAPAGAFGRLRRKGANFEMHRTKFV